MPRRCELSEIEMRRVWSECGTSKIINRSKTTILNILSKKELYGTNKQSGLENIYTMHKRIGIENLNIHICMYVIETRNVIFTLHLWCPLDKGHKCLLGLLSMFFSLFASYFLIFIYTYIYIFLDLN